VCLKTGGSGHNVPQSVSTDVVMPKTRIKRLISLTVSHTIISLMPTKVWSKLSVKRTNVFNIIHIVARSRT